jgi:hypothetical protein
MQSYPLASAWIDKKIGEHGDLYDAVASAGGFLVIDDFLPANIAVGVESLLRWYFFISSRAHHPLIFFAPACPPMRGTLRRLKTIRGITISSTYFRGESLCSSTLRFAFVSSHIHLSSKGAISPKAAAAAALKLPGATSKTAAAAAASVKLLPLVFRLFSILNPEDFHTFSAAK